MNEEIWKPVVGFEGLYDVSNLGYVRTLLVSNKVPVVPYTLSRIINDAGYPVVSLYRNGKLHRRLIHRLVLQSFVGTCPAGKECAHLGGCRTNAKLDNLKWKYPKENCADRLLHGTHLVGAASPLAKLTKEQVIEVRELSNSKPQHIIAKLFGVHQVTISRVIRKATYANS